MSATVHRLPVPARPDPDLFIETAQRTWLAVEDALAGDWSDSTLIATYFAAGPDAAAQILAELEARAKGGRHG